MAERHKQQYINMVEIPSNITRDKYVLKLKRWIYAYELQKTKAWRQRDWWQSWEENNQEHDSQCIHLSIDELVLWSRGMDRWYNVRPFYHTYH